MKLSIVTTLFQSSLHIDEFYNRITCSAKKITNDYEIIFVNDGSPDNSLDLVLKLYESDKHLKVVDLSRNFGHHQAIMCGLTYSSGEYTFLIDSDLDEPPELLTEFWESIHEGGCDIVVGEQKVRRKQSLVNTKLHGLFYWIFNKLNRDKLSPTEMVVRLMNRAYVDAIVKYEEYNLFLPSVWNDLGFVKRSVLADKAESASSYTLRKKLLLSLDALTSASSMLIHMLFFIGLFIFILTSFSAIVMVVQWFFYEVELGWTSLIISIWLGVGIIMMTLGIVGIYIAKIFNEVKSRPRVSIRNIYK